MVRLSLDDIEALAFDALTRAGAAAHQARPVALATRRAEADGISSVGLGYLPIYLQHLRSGKVAGRAAPVLQPATRPTAIRVDARSGFAHPAFDAGISALATAATANGMAGLSIYNSYSIGVLGHPVEDIAERGFVALGFANSPPNMTAWGGRRRIFGTNPMALGIPRKGTAPTVFDQASTVVTKVQLASKAASGEPIPVDWAFDADGSPTTDPSTALKGSMAPFGGAKGANIALLVEIMAVLAGANPSMDIQPYAIADGPPPGAGQFFVALDPTAFSSDFADRVAQIANAYANEENARLPGDRRLAARAAAARDGVAVDGQLLATIAA
jgi:(2R)-3-sulfolactate dehydrogenase (NADP+)